MENDYLDRLETEQCDLSQKILKLDDFIHSNRFYEIDEIQKDLMQIQLSVMKSYCDILQTRRQYISR